MPHRRLYLSIIISAVAIALFPLHRNDLGWIDPVSGSTKHQIKLFGVSVSTVIEQSTLERWIVDHEGRYTNDWRFLHDTSSHLVYGKTYACGMTPEIYSLSKSELNDAFVRGSSDKEIAEFVKIMRTGTPSEQKLAVDQACEKALDLLKHETR